MFAGSRLVCLASPLVTGLSLAQSAMAQSERSPSTTEESSSSHRVGSPILLFDGTFPEGHGIIPTELPLVSRETSVHLAPSLIGIRNQVEFDDLNTGSRRKEKGKSNGWSAAAGGIVSVDDAKRIHLGAEVRYSRIGEEANQDGLDSETRLTQVSAYGNLLVGGGLNIGLALTSERQSEEEDDVGPATASVLIPSFGLGYHDEAHAFDFGVGVRDKDEDKYVETRVTQNASGTTSNTKNVSTSLERPGRARVKYLFSPTPQYSVGGGVSYTDEVANPGQSMPKLSQKLRYSLLGGAVVSKFATVQARLEFERRQFIGSESIGLWHGGFDAIFDTALGTLVPSVSLVRGHADYGIGNAEVTIWAYEGKLTYRKTF